MLQTSRGYTYTAQAHRDSAVAGYIYTAQAHRDSAVEGYIYTV